MQCSICQAEVESKSALANHVRWKHKRNDVQCEGCGTTLPASSLKQHQSKCERFHPCQTCGTKTFNESYCSKSCAASANNSKGTIGYAVYRAKKKISKRQTYRDICFEHWPHKCALCDWTICLDVHHIDDDHTNNDPKNLVPLCQNHHTMTRMIEHRGPLREILSELSARRHEFRAT